MAKLNVVAVLTHDDRAEIRIESGGHMRKIEVTMSDDMPGSVCLSLVDFDKYRFDLAAEDIVFIDERTIQEDA